MKKHSQFAAFTLIELLVVMAIITILAALVLSTAGYVQKKGARSRAEAEIAALGAALESYKADNGDYPTNGISSNTACLVTNLMPTNGQSNAYGGTKVYYEFKTNSLDTNNNFLDPFGYGYYYIYTNGAPNNGTNNYDLWSTAGGLGTSNTWIKNY
jgi:prepilin-type N-terminal cleavage/methylation domain-containing protein